jgi:hypothetical protein
MTTSAFKPLTTAEKIFKDLVWDPMLKAGEKWLEGAVPFFSLPVVSSLEESVAQELSDAFYTQMCLLIDISVIKLVDEQHDKAFRDAATKLHLVADQYGPNSEEFQKENENAKSALAAVFTRHIA